MAGGPWRSTRPTAHRQWPPACVSRPVGPRERLSDAVSGFERAWHIADRGTESKLRSTTEIGIQQAQTLGCFGRHQTTTSSKSSCRSRLATHSKNGVGMAGFEPAASCSQSRRANQAALHPGPFHPSSATQARSFGRGRCASVWEPGWPAITSLPARRDRQDLAR